MMEIITNINKNILLYLRLNLVALKTLSIHLTYFIKSIFEIKKRQYAYS